MVQPKKVAQYNLNPSVHTRDSNLGVADDELVPRQLVHQGLHCVSAIGHGYCEIVTGYIQKFFFSYAVVK